MSRLSTKARRSRRRRRDFQRYMAMARKIRARIKSAPRASLLDFARRVAETGPESEVLRALSQGNPILRTALAAGPLMQTGLQTPSVKWFKIPRTP